MYGVVGSVLFCVGLLVMKAAIAGARRQPVPRWLSDDMQAYLVVPFIVTALVVGIASLGTWLIGGHWRNESLIGWGVMAASAAAYVLIRRMLPSAELAPPVPLGVVEGARPQDPGRPPQRPPLKKAA